MRPFTWHSACELLKKGAVIEVVQWKTIQPYIRLESEDVFEKVNRTTFHALLRSKQITLVKEEWATKYYKLTELVQQKLLQSSLSGKLTSQNKEK